MSDHAVLTIRKHADRSSARRVTRFVVTGIDDEGNDVVEKRLVNPATPGNDHEPWPLSHITFADANGNEVDPPRLTTISTGKVKEWMNDGFLYGEGGRLVVRPGGPAEDPTRPDKSHTFTHYDTLSFLTGNGVVTYRVTHQPDKYADHAEATYEIDEFTADDDTPVTDEMYEAGATRVDNFYTLELVEG